MKYTHTYTTFCYCCWCCVIFHASAKCLEHAFKIQSFPFLARDCWWEDFQVISLRSNMYIYNKVDFFFALEAKTHTAVSCNAAIVCFIIFYCSPINQIESSEEKIKKNKKRGLQIQLIRCEDFELELHHVQ